MTKDLFAQLRKELVSLEGLLRGTSAALLPSQKRLIEEKLSKVDLLAVRIGGKTLMDAERFKAHMGRFLEGEMESSEIHALLVEALKLEQQTREL